MKPPEDRLPDAGIDANVIPFGKRGKPSTGLADVMKIIDEIANASDRAGLVQAKLVPALSRLRAADRSEARKAASERLNIGVGDLRDAVKENRQIATAAMRGSLAMEPGAGANVSQADRLVMMVRNQYIFGRSDDGGPFVVPTDGPKVARALRGCRSSLRTELSAAYFEAVEKVPSSSALTDALLAVEGFAMREHPTKLHLRYACRSGVIFVDLGCDAGVIVQVDADGWRITSSRHAPVTFRRTTLTGELPAPERGGDLTVLKNILGVANNAWQLIVGWMIAAMMPDIPRPVLLLDGEQGTAKTTTTRMLVGLIDPSPMMTRCMPREERDWITAAADSSLVALDNVSRMPDWLSDALCRAVTGEGFARRRLFTDGDTVVTHFQRAIILNGIDVGATRGDLIDRIVRIELPRIAESQRRLEADMREEYEKARPAILGGLFDLLSAVLRELPKTTVAEPPRMADFARVLAAIDKVNGWRSLQNYLRNQRRAMGDAVHADHVAIAVAALLDDRGTLELPAADLLQALDDRRGASRAPKGWPTTPQHFAARLRLAAPSLRSAGYDITDKHDTSGRRIWILSRADGKGISSSAPSVAPPGTPVPDGTDAADGDLRGLSGRLEEQEAAWEEL